MSLAVWRGRSERMEEETAALLHAALFVSATCVSVCAWRSRLSLPNPCLHPICSV
jgi:hypothetical protein